MESLLSRLIDPADLRPDLATTVEASAGERAAIAGQLGLLGLETLTAELTIERLPNGIVTVTGRVHADVTQRCVVSLEPVEQTLDEEISRRFVPEGDHRAVPAVESVDVLAESEDPPETFPPRGIDVGAVVLEQFVLGLDPYPRAPGVELPAEAIDPDAASDSPFAVLKSLGHSKP